MRAFVAPALLLMLVSTARTGVAQDTRQPRVSVATNPIAIPFGAFSAEIEGAIGGGFAAGVGGTLDSDSDNLSWAQAKLKYYPGRVPLVGFAAGVTAGIMHARDVTTCPAPAQMPCVLTTENAPMIGVVLDHNWLVGRNRRLLLGAGIGVQRVFTDFRDQIDENQLDGRLVVGWTF